MYIFERVDTGWILMACRSDVFLQYLLMPRDDLQQTRLYPIHFFQFRLGYSHTLHSVCENGLQGGPPHVGNRFCVSPLGWRPTGCIMWEVRRHAAIRESACIALSGAHYLYSMSVTW